MVLIVDSNEYRRVKLARRCRTNDIPAMSIGYDDFNYYTKPLVTVLIDPSKAFMQQLNKTEKTLFVVVVKREDQISLYQDICTVCNSIGEITPEQIREVILNNYGYTLNEDSFNCIYINYDNKLCRVRNKKLFITKTELKIIRFFLYNYERIFRYDEIFEYLHYTDRIKIKTFDGYTQAINRKSDKAHREHLIFKRKTGYEMPQLTGINPYFYDQRFNVLLI
ncbi:MAG: hypothetical protein IJW19_07580 [Clostridia bacterium]|nr:hypothetical protein [Clostridia bacterium]